MTFGLPLRQAAAFGAALEEAGFSGVVVTEGGRTAYLTCAALSVATRTLELGTGIAVAFPRSPMVTAQVAWELAEASGGRFRLGLGTQVRAHIERRYATSFEHPGPRLAEYVQAVRACFRAFRGEEPLSFEGTYYRLSLLPPAWSPGPIGAPDPPVEMAAVNPFLLRLAGRVADGVHVHPLNHRRYLEDVVVPEVAAGPTEAGRDPGEVALTVPVMTVAGESEEDRATRREAARAQVAFYGSTPNYAFLFDLLGRPETTGRLRAHQRAGDSAAMISVIDDDLLAAFVCEGSFEDLPALLEERLGGVADRAVLYLAGLPLATDRRLLGRYGEVARAVAG
jgi:probable F420-dependent oxidoreductase